MDATGSMGSWISRAQETLIEIIDNVSKEMKAEIPEGENFNIRVSFVAYRDIKTREGRFVIQSFTEDVEKTKTLIKSTRAAGGEDGPEDV